MFGDYKDMSENLKDTAKNPLKDSVSLDVLYKGHPADFSYHPKLNKLITALYMVTDIIEKDEPIRLKLRTLGAEILSDIRHSSRTEIFSKVQTILSFLDIALTIRLVSEMNLNILKKEFKELAESLKVVAIKEVNQVNHVWLEEFLKPDQALGLSREAENTKDIRSKSDTYIGVTINKDENTSFLIKKQRREDILKAIKDNGGSATITEVRLKASEALATCGEKTLQRELVSMLKDQILDKTGEKRWSRYSIKNGNEVSNKSYS
mgnify:CR=1 FL=1